MILTFKKPYCSAVNLSCVREIQGYEFVDPPVEYRFLRDHEPVSDWLSPVTGFISLVRPVVTDEGVRTRGLDATNLVLETRGLVGHFILLVWPRH
jgi:hypothetical protein